MDYRTFVEKMKEQVQGKSGKSYEVQIITTTKLNGTEKNRSFNQQNAGTAASGSCALSGRMF